jgi:tetratricopeptide (TPR) repeat protein
MNVSPASNSNADRTAKVVGRAETLMRSGRIDEAAELARKALAAGFEHARLLDLRAYWFEQQGRDMDALEDLNRAVELAPGDAQVRNAQALLLMKLNRRHQAVIAYQALAEIAPESATVHCSLGSAKEAIGQLDAAERCFRRAIALNAGCVEAWASLAGLANRRGRWAEAHELADKALVLDALSWSALIAHAKAYIGERNTSAAQDLLVNRVLPNDKLPPLERSQAMGVLGDQRHAEGRYAEAFHAYRECNLLRYRLFQPLLEPEGSETSFTYAEWLIENFSQIGFGDIVARQRRAEADNADLGGARAHVFLVGFPRSGTTLLENVLASHPDVVALGERGCLDNARAALGLSSNGLERFKALTEDELRQHRVNYWKSVKENGAEVSGKVFVDKNPLHSMQIGLIATLFPRAKILFALRDPRDVVLGCFRRIFEMNQSMFEFLSIERCARFYDAVMRLRETYRGGSGLAWIDLRNEDLIADFEREMHRVLEFMELAWNDSVRDFAEDARGRRIATPSSTQIMRGLNSDGVAQWRHYKAELSPVLPILRPWVEAFGYPGD